MKVYFCSYMVIKNGSVFAYGDTSFDGSIKYLDDVMQGIKDKIKDLYYKDLEVDIVLTALNEI